MTRTMTVGEVAKIRIWLESVTMKSATTPRWERGLD